MVVKNMVLCIFADQGAAKLQKVNDGLMKFLAWPSKCHLAGQGRDSIFLDPKFDFK